MNKGSFTYNSNIVKDEPWFLKSKILLVYSYNKRHYKGELTNSDSEPTNREYDARS